MKRIIFFASVMLMSLSGCQHKELLSPDDSAPETRPSGFYGTIEDGEATKTYLDGQIVRWSQGDKVAIFEGATSAGCYQVGDEYAGEYCGYFDKVSEAPGDGAAIGHNIAFYPYSEKLQCEAASEDASSSVSYMLKNVLLEPKQDHFTDSFHGERYPMVAVSASADERELLFRNICGGLIIRLKGDKKVMYMTLKGRHEEKISGYATVVAYADGRAPEVKVGSDAFSVVSLYCGKGVQLDPDEATSFYITLPPTDFKEGFILTVYDASGGMTTLETDKLQQIRRSAFLRMPVVDCSDEAEFDDAVDLSVDGTANSYVVSGPGCYKLPAVKGNSDESVGAVASADVIWETLGTAEAPQVGDLVAATGFEDGYVLFRTQDEFKEGNALIAAKDASGTILWSWHIWMVEDEIQEQMYANGTGVMMDRNLGATASYPDGGDVYGLLYQWGRKDPFMARSGMAATAQHSYSASPVSIEYATQNPTAIFRYQSTDILFPGNDVGDDWCGPEEQVAADSRWESEKTVYDPCPAGWRVPDGGPDGIWAMAGFAQSGCEYQSGMLWVPSECSGAESYYPFTGTDQLVVINNARYSNYWSATSASEDKSYLLSYYSQYDRVTMTVDAQDFKERRSSVRCYKIGSNTSGIYVPVSSVSLDYSSVDMAVGETLSLEASVAPGNATDKNIVWLSSNTAVASVQDGVVTARKEGAATIMATCGGCVATCYVNVVAVPDKDGAVDLDYEGRSANCYIISEKGCYRFRPVKGNSSVSVGDVASVEVLWESFATEDVPLVGEILREVIFEDGYVYLWTSEEYKKGNALVAAKGADGTILWSWHIWLTDVPGENVYADGAGTLMDRNLGAVSALPDEAGAFGLLYQWGRKDPFLGRASLMRTDMKASSSVQVGGYEVEDEETGTVAYSVTHPATLIAAKGYNGYGDWLFDESGKDGEYYRWKSEKTMYDPCPAGWRVSDGGYGSVLYRSGVLSQPYETVQGGIVLPSGYCGGASAYFPASGKLMGRTLTASGVAYSPLYLWGTGSAVCWTVSPMHQGAPTSFYTLDFAGTDSYMEYDPCEGLPVRCQKE